jgi:hypothetical protein
MFVPGRVQVRTSRRLNSPGLRKTVIEMPRNYEKFPGLRTFEGVESFRIIDFLRFDGKSFAVIFQAKIMDSRARKRFERLKNLTNLQILSEEPDGSFIAYAEGRQQLELDRFIEKAGGGYFYPPFEITPSNWKMTYLGSKAQTRRLLRVLEKAELPHRIAFAGEARFSRASLLNGLTEKQRQVLKTAYDSGYYDVPRKINSEKLAKSMKLVKSTVVEHLRKTEKYLLDNIFAGPA